MDQQPLKSRRNRLKSRLQARKYKSQLIIGTIIATFIAITPSFLPSYESAPSVAACKPSFFNYDSKSWGDVRLVMWIFTSKIIPLMLIIIWFFTCRHWWYHALLVPIIMYLYQIFVLFNDDLNYIDELQFIYMLPVMAIVIPSIYLIRAKIFDKLNTVDKSMQDLEDELKIRPKGIIGKLKDYF